MCTEEGFYIYLIFKDVNDAIFYNYDNYYLFYRYVNVQYLQIPFNSNSLQTLCAQTFFSLLSRHLNVSPKFLYTTIRVTDMVVLN